MRVVAIEELISLSSAELRIAQRCIYWPADGAGQRELRVYRLQGAGVMIAPSNPAIGPGMEIVALGGVAMAFQDSFGENSGQDSVEVRCAQAVTER